MIGEASMLCPYCAQPFEPGDEITSNENEDVVHLKCELRVEGEVAEELAGRFSSIEVVNMRNCNPPWGQPGDVRIDRKTKWGNPFIMKKESDRDGVCDDYERYFIMMQKDFGLDISELMDAKRLGCWCKPKRCHGDFLKSLVDREKIGSMIQ